MHHNGYRLVLFAVVAVVCVFLFHLPAGPWSAVNGPATALQAARYALTIFLLISMAGFPETIFSGYRDALTNVLLCPRAELQRQLAPAALAGKTHPLLT